MNNLIPDIYAHNIFTINYDNLKNRGIKCLLFDLDNTIASNHMKKPTEEIKKLFQELDVKGFKIIIVSNAYKSRVAAFKEELNVDASYFSCKPFKIKYKKILKLYKFKISEVATIGDQLLTDVKGGNKMGFTTILVEPLGPDPFIGTWVGRFFERFIFANLKKRGIYEKGKYYE